MLLRSCVDFTSDRLLLNVLWTDWFAWGPGSNRSILCPILGSSTKNIAGVFRCSFPGIVPLGCSSLRRPGSLLPDLSQFFQAAKIIVLLDPAFHSKFRQNRHHMTDGDSG